MVSSDTVHKIACEHLDIGMKVVELDCPWIESPFTVHGFRISTERELEQLKTTCKYVYVAVKTEKPTDTGGTDLKRQTYTDSLPLDKAMPQAKSAHRQAKSVVNGFLNNLRLGQTFDTSVAKKAVKQCVNSIIANQEAMLWLGLLKDVDEYTARHSLNVGLLAIILGRAEGLSRVDLENVGLCGMLHDMGKSKIPLEILNKEGAFSDEEFEVMKSHTTLGFEILDQKADIIEEAANVALSHHERLNGRGYPRALKAEDISYFSRIVAIVDAYDAITSQRIYSPAKTSLEALRILIGAKGSHFDPDLVDRFVECIGIYPAGSVAELSTKEVVIILPTPHKKRNSPRVLVVRNASKKACEEKLLDLSQEPKDSNGDLITIKHLLSDNAFGIELSKYHNHGTRTD